MRRRQAQDRVLLRSATDSVGRAGGAHSPLMPGAACPGPHRGASSQLSASCALPRRPMQARRLETQVPSSVRLRWGTGLSTAGGGGGVRGTLWGAVVATLPSTACLSCGHPVLMKMGPSVDPRLLGAQALTLDGPWVGVGKRPSHRHMQQRFFQRQTKSPDSYCLHLFSAQEAEQVPTWTWGHTAPVPHSPSPAATPCRPHSENRV